jgi:hypothetical protein
VNSVHRSAALQAAADRCSVAGGAVTTRIKNWIGRSTRRRDGTYFGGRYGSIPSPGARSSRAESRVTPAVQVRVRCDRVCVVSGDIGLAANTARIHVLNQSPAIAIRSTVVFVDKIEA